MFHFENLDEITRHYMLLEVEQAIRASQLHLSQRFTAQGRERYPDLLRTAVQEGDEASLAKALLQQGCLAEREPYGTGTRRVPASAARTFAEGQFNAFYMRGVCHRAIQAGRPVAVYRAKPVAHERPASASESNPQFHQQMVYAVAMTTIHNFEQALGRRVQ